MKEKIHNALRKLLQEKLLKEGSKLLENNSNGGHVSIAGENYFRARNIGTNFSLDNKTEQQLVSWMKSKGFKNLDIQHARKAFKEQEALG